MHTVVWSIGLHHCNIYHLEMFGRPGSSSSSEQLFKQGKGRPASGRPGSGHSLSSLGETGVGAGEAGPVSVSSSDSGVDVSPSPGLLNTCTLLLELSINSVSFPESPKEGFPSIKKVKTKDDLLLMLNKIKIEDGSERRQELKLEEWQ